MNYDYVPCEADIPEPGKPVYAMLHCEGDWEKIELSAALELVRQGKACEMPPAETTHYDDGMQSFDRFSAVEDSDA